MTPKKGTFTASAVQVRSASGADERWRRRGSTCGHEEAMRLVQYDDGITAIVQGSSIETGL